MSDQLYERVSSVLRSHGLGHFSDLSSAEQITLLEEAHREIASEDNKASYSVNLGPFLAEKFVTLLYRMVHRAARLYHTCSIELLLT